MLTPDILTQLESYFTLEKSKESFSSLALIFSTTVLGFKAAQVEREFYLSELSKHFKVALYTNLPTPSLPLVENLGLAEYGTATSQIYQNSKINLNFTIPNIESGIPLRVFDILACQGFLLTNYQPELPEYFTPGKDLVIFEDCADLIAKADYYLSHEEERRTIAQNGYQKVLKHHTYSQRVKEMLQICELPTS